MNGLDVIDDTESRTPKNTDVVASPGGMHKDENFGRKLVTLVTLHLISWPLTRSGAFVGEGSFLMPYHFKALSAALSIVAVATVAMVAPGRAQQEPPAAGQEPVPDAKPQDDPAPDAQAPAVQAPAAQAPAAAIRSGRARSASVIANVNLRSGPGTDSEIITTIPAGNTVRIASCSGEWCEVTWNERSGYAIARNLSTGAPRQARAYGPQPGYAGGYESEPPAVYEAPGYYAPPAVVYGPAYYGSRVYYGYGPGWGWRRRW